MRGRILLISFLCAAVIVVAIFALWRREAKQPNVADNPAAQPVEQKDAPPPAVPEPPAPQTISREEAIAALEKASVVLIRDQDVVSSVDFPAGQESDLLRYLSAFQELRGLKIRRMSVGEDHLAPLLELKQLQVLDLQICWLADDSIETLARHPSLSIVMFNHVNVDDDDLITLSRLPKLDSLIITDSQVSLIGMGHFHIARPEVMLRVDPKPIGERDLAKRYEKLGGKVLLDNFGKVAAIDLTGTIVTDNDLRDLKLCTEIKSLSLRQTKITDDGLKHLESLTKLEEFFVHGSQVTNKQLQEFVKSMPRLGLIDGNPNPNESSSTTTPEERDFRVLVPPPRAGDIDTLVLESSRLFVRKNVKLTEVEKLAGAKVVDSLYFIDSKIDDESLPAFGNLRQLKTIYFRGGKPNLSGLVVSNSADWLDQIHSMYLIDVDVTYAELAHISWFRGLRKVTLVGEQVTDESVLDLALLPSLRELSLVRTAVTDEAIPTLSQLSLLQSLYLTQTKISNEGIELLMQALPDCTIHR